ncbi:hydantoinase B/oxoprolinase family protein [Rhodopila sp.]|uniref:hydantoinase B/oxoprolinase family protein n=1 Tax=Rhodopila sp. TaxID=2480087 RepID=UPI003D0C64DD
MDIDPITLEVLRNELDGISNEMQLTLVRSAFSAIVKEGLDASASLFTLGGETLAQALAVPVHLGALTPMVGRLLQTVPLEQMGEDDIWILNDTYLGGTHLPDIAIMTPVFVDGRVIAISAAMTHHQDVGGMTPGSTPTNATEIFQEGIRIPLLKFRSGWVLNDTLIAMLRQNVRLPDVLLGDINAQVAACTTGARRLTELAGGFGREELLALFDELLNRSETMTGQALRGLSPGTYRYVDYLDNDGIELDQLVRVEVAVTIDGDTMTCDFTGTSAQVRGPFNCMPSGPYAAACFALRAVTDPEGRIPNNGGCFRPLRFNLPVGSLVNPHEPAPTGCRTSTIKRVACCILGALRQAAPDRVPADSASETVIMHFGGRCSDGRRYVTSQLLVSGSGASAAFDGVDVIETDASNCLNVPAEALMMEAPIRVHRAALHRDSGGPGKARGGLGGVYEYELLDGEATVTYRGERHLCQAAGSDGGLAGGRARAVIKRADGAEEVVKSKIVTTLRKGDRLMIATAGGGGYGHPQDREPPQVLADLRNGKISLESAREFYDWRGNI